MAYQVFARKYRPRSFEEVVGQEHITRTLENAIRLGRIAQTYLFVGPRGTGKTSTARILAKALNCSNGPRIDFDLNDDICVEIAEGRSLDVLEIDGASNNGVEQVRDLRDNVRYAPVRGRYKIYIIDEVHMLTGAAFNALLKTLEEPPAHVKFIFATTEVHKLPATILSRCQRFDLRRIPDTLIAAHLGKICKNEGVEAEPAALAAIARYAEGGLRDAESALDQVIGFYGDRVTETEVLAQFGLSGFGPVASLADCIIHGDVVQALTETRNFVRGGKDLGRLSQDLLRFFRNLIVYQIAPGTLASELPQPELDALAAAAVQISRSGATAVLEELGTLESRLRYALSKDVLFEVAVIQLCQLREKISLESILIKLGGDKDAPPRSGYAARSVAMGSEARESVPVRSTFVTETPVSATPLAAAPVGVAPAVAKPVAVSEPAQVAVAAPAVEKIEAKVVAAPSAEASAPVSLAPAPATEPNAGTKPEPEPEPEPLAHEVAQAPAEEALPQLFSPAAAVTDAAAGPASEAAVPAEPVGAPEDPGLFGSLFAPAPEPAAPAALATTPIPEPVAVPLPKAPLSEKAAGTEAAVKVEAPANPEKEPVPASAEAAPLKPAESVAVAPPTPVVSAVEPSSDVAPSSVPAPNAVPAPEATVQAPEPVPEPEPDPVVAEVVAPVATPAPAPTSTPASAPEPAPAAPVVERQKYIPSSLGVAPAPAPVSTSSAAAGGDEERSPFAGDGDDGPPASTAAASSAPAKGRGGKGKSGSASAAAASKAATNAGRRLENPSETWGIVAGKFAEVRPNETQMIKSMRVHDSRGAEIHIKVPTKFGNKLNWLRHKKNLEIIETAFQEEVGFVPMITFILADIDEAPATVIEDGPAGKLDSKDFENDPLIKQALELFEARIVRRP